MQFAKEKNLLIENENELKREVVDENVDTNASQINTSQVKNLSKVNQSEVKNDNEMKEEKSQQEVQANQDDLDKEKVASVDLEQSTIKEGVKVNMTAWNLLTRGIAKMILNEDPEKYSRYMKVTKSRVQN